MSDFEISGKKCSFDYDTLISNFSSNTFICPIKFSLHSKDGNVDEDGRKRRCRKK